MSATRRSPAIARVGSVARTGTDFGLGFRGLEFRGLGFVKGLGFRGLGV